MYPLELYIYIYIYVYIYIYLYIYIYIYIYIFIYIYITGVLVGGGGVGGACPPPQIKFNHGLFSMYRQNTLLLIKLGYFFLFESFQINPCHFKIKLP